MTSNVLRSLIKEMDNIFAKYHFNNILTYDSGNHKMLQFELHNDWETASIKCTQFVYRIESDETLTYISQFEINENDSTKISNNIIKDIDL